MNGTVPVLVCGAGPTGMALALELARFGVPFRVIDRAAEGARFSQATAIQARTLELLEATGITDRLLNGAQLVEHVRLFSGTQPLFDVSFTGMPTRYSFLAMLPQTETERVMREQLTVHGVAVERGVELRALAEHPDGVEVELASERGTERIRAAFVAACDGAESTVRRLLDLAFTGHAPPERFAVADVLLDTDLPRDTLRVALAPDGGAVALVPLRATWRVLIEPTEPLPDPPTPAALQAALDGYGIPARIVEVARAATYHVHQRDVATYRVGRTFLLGDAAHVHSPLGGQGMNSGIGDAVNLGWKLALVVRDGVDAGLLETYADERGAVGRALLAATDYGNRIALNANTAVRALRNAVLPVAAHVGLVHDRLRDNVAQLRIAYPHSRLSVNGAPARRGLRAGMRVRGYRPAGYRPQAIVVDPHNQAAALTLVLRPDGYAGYVADGVHANGATTYLRNVIGLDHLTAAPPPARR